MTKRKRKHPGVSWIKADPEARTGWRVKYRDPDTGKITKRTPDVPTGTMAQREDYAVRLSERLARRRREIDGGAVRATGTSLKDAETRFYSSLAKKAARTTETYHEGSDPFLDWAKQHRIATCDDLTRGRVIEFREHLLAEAGSPHTFNKKLRAVKRMLGYWIDAELCPRLDHDDLRRVKQEDAPVERRDFLRPKQIKKLLESAERHDAATYSMTRREKSGETEKGGTPRYDAIAPFTVFVLLTGMRLSEAIDLTWKDVDLSALDHTGREVGELYVRAADSKTKKHRTVGLEVSPALRKLLAAQKLRTGSKGRVWSNVTRDGAIKAMRRLRATYGAPESFNWQALRRTASTFLVNSPGIFGGASAYMAAKQLGHGVKVMESNYSGLVRGIPIDARDLESAMQIQDEAARIVASATAPMRAPAAIPKN